MRSVSCTNGAVRGVHRKTVLCGVCIEILALSQPQAWSHPGRGKCSRGTAPTSTRRSCPISAALCKGEGGRGRSGQGTEGRGGGRRSSSETGNRVRASNRQRTDGRNTRSRWLLSASHAAGRGREERTVADEIKAHEALCAVALRRRAQPCCECRLQARTGGPHAGGDDVVTRASVSDDGGELRQVEQCEGPPPGARTLSATKSRTSENIVRAAGRRHSHPVASDDDGPSSRRCLYYWVPSTSTVLWIRQCIHEGSRRGLPDAAARAARGGAQEVSVDAWHQHRPRERRGEDVLARLGGRRAFWLGAARPPRPARCRPVGRPGACGCPGRASLGTSCSRGGCVYAARCGACS